MPFFSHLHIRNSVGLTGENEAVDLLEKKGYRILERNWKMGHLEVDIIAENKEVIAFVEVKARTSDFKRPEQYVDAAKKHRMQSAANVYMRATRSGKSPRFDIIGVQMDKEKRNILSITHLENAFMPVLKSYGVPV